MSNRTVIASAGNVLPAALATLRSLGYVVTVTGNGRLCVAENGACKLVAEDPLLLLGLAKLHEVRGNAWASTDAEVDECLAFDAPHIADARDRADVWEESGAVHVLCVTAWGDPVELGEAEARDFAIRLDKAIAEAAPK